MTSEGGAESDASHEPGGADDGWPGPRHMQIFGWVVATLIIAVCVYIALV